MATLDVLILDDPDSRHAQPVQDALAVRGATSQRLNCTDLRDWSVDISVGEIRLRCGDLEWEVSPATTVWYRRLGSPSVDDLDLDEAQLARDELPHALVGGLIACGARWVDEPSTVERAEHKLFQLSTASRLDVAIPLSVVTNDSLAASRTLSEMRLAAKPLSPGQGIAPHVDEVYESDISEMAGVSVLLQELIARADADLRVVVVGSHAWTWRRPRTPDTIDWRAEDPRGSGFQYVSPHAVEGAAIAITSALGLTMSVQDWLTTPDGAVFLEANPQGAWAFLDGSDKHIPEALAAHLCGQTAQTLADGVWPKPLKRVRWDLGRESKAPEDDGVVAPQFAPPSWASAAARSPAALPVVQRANDEAKAGAKAAEDKAVRLVRTALATLAVATALLGYQLRFALDNGLWWLPLLIPVSAAFICLVIAAFEAYEIDRVGVYQHPTGRDLTEPGPRDPIVPVIENEDVGRRLAEWSSRHKHTALMQARAWFTRGLTLLVAAVIAAAVSWAFDASDSNPAPTPEQEPATNTSPDPVDPAGTDEQP